MEAAEKQSANFRQQIPVQKQAEPSNKLQMKVPFYNWLRRKRVGGIICLQKHNGIIA